MRSPEVVDADAARKSTQISRQHQDHVGLQAIAPIQVVALLRQPRQQLPCRTGLGHH